jgi:hypothetical protein
MQPLHSALCTLTITLLFAGCADENPAAAASDECRTFSTSLSVKDRMSQPVNAFTPGEPITFELQTTNTTNATATLTAGSSCTAVVFEVFDSAKQRHWGSADGIACIQMLQPRTYAPLESTTNASTWDQQSATAQVPSGTYTVTANVGQYVTNAQGQQFSCREQLSKSATFTIQ